MVSFSPLKAFIYQDGLVRFGTQKYEGLEEGCDLSNVFSHLTNSSINKVRGRGLHGVVARRFTTTRLSPPHSTTPVILRP